MAAQFDHSGLKRRTAPAVRIVDSGDSSLVFGLAEVPPMPSLRTHQWSADSEMKQKPVIELSLNGTEDEWFEMIRALKIIRSRNPDARCNVVQQVGKVTYAFNISRDLISVWISR